MTSKKICVCEFDKFTLRHLIRPYQNMIGLGDKAVKKNPYSYETLFKMLSEDTEWSNDVLDRARRIGFDFSQWIQGEYERKIINLILKP